MSQWDFLLVNHAPANAITPIAMLTAPRTPWLPWLTLPEWPTEFSGPNPTPAKKRMARTMKTTPMIASTMTSGRFEPAPPETVSELTTSSLGGVILCRAVAAPGEQMFPRVPPAGGPPGGEFITSENVLLAHGGNRLLQENALDFRDARDTRKHPMYLVLAGRGIVTAAFPCGCAGNR